MNRADRVEVRIQRAAEPTVMASQFSNAPIHSKRQNHLAHYVGVYPTNYRTSPFLLLDGTTSTIHDDAFELPLLSPQQLVDWLNSRRGVMMLIPTI